MPPSAAWRCAAAARASPPLCSVASPSSAGTAGSGPFFALRQRARWTAAQEDAIFFAHRFQSVRSFARLNATVPACVASFARRRYATKRPPAARALRSAESIEEIADKESASPDQQRRILQERAEEFIGLLQGLAMPSKSERFRTEAQREAAEARLAERARVAAEYLRNLLLALPTLEVVRRTPSASQTTDATGQAPSNPQQGAPAKPHLPDPCLLLEIVKLTRANTGHELGIKASRKLIEELVGIGYPETALFILLDRAQYGADFDAQSLLTIQKALLERCTQAERAAPRPTSALPGVVTLPLKTATSPQERSDSAGVGDKPMAQGGQNQTSSPPTSPNELLAFKEELLQRMLVVASLARASSDARKEVVPPRKRSSGAGATVSGADDADSAYLQMLILSARMDVILCAGDGGLEDSIEAYMTDEAQAPYDRVFPLLLRRAVADLQASQQQILKPPAPLPPPRTLHPAALPARRPMAAAALAASVPAAAALKAPSVPAPAALRRGASSGAVTPLPLSLLADALQYYTVRLPVASGAALAQLRIPSAEPVRTLYAYLERFYPGAQTEQIIDDCESALNGHASSVWGPKTEDK